MHSWQQDSLTHTLTTAAGLKGGFLLFLFSQKASLEYWPKYLLWLLRRVTHGCHWWVLLRNHHCERIRKKDRCMKYFISQLTGIILKSHQKCSLLVIYVFWEVIFKLYPLCIVAGGDTPFEHSTINEKFFQHHHSIASKWCNDDHSSKHFRAEYHNHF